MSKIKKFEFGGPVQIGPVTIDPVSTAILTGVSLFRSLSDKRKKEFQKNENLFLLTVDLMRQAGEDPYEMFPADDTGAAQEYANLAALSMGETPRDIRAEAIADAVYNWRQRNQGLVKEAYDKFVASGMDYKDYSKSVFSPTPEGDDPGSYEVVNFPTGLEGEYTDANGTRWGYSDSTRTRWIISEKKNDSGGGGSDEAKQEAINDWLEKNPNATEEEIRAVLDDYLNRVPNAYELFKKATGKNVSDYVNDTICDGPNETKNQVGQCVCEEGYERDENNVCVEVTIPGDPCDDPVYAANNPEDCEPIIERPCGENEVKDENGFCVCKPGYARKEEGNLDYPCEPVKDDSCDDPVYAALNPEECDGGTGGGDCDDPIYAAANPEECDGGTGGGDCDDPIYAAANPEECDGGIGKGTCDDPVYAAANPEECDGGTGGGTCDDPVYAALNPDICGEGTGEGTCGDPNATKNAAGECVCNEGFAPDASGKCVGTGPGRCTADNEILNEADQCVCKDGFERNENNECVGKGTGPGGEGEGDCDNPVYAALYPEECTEAKTPAPPISLGGTGTTITSEASGLAPMTDAYNITTGQYVPFDEYLYGMASGGRVRQNSLVDDLIRLLGD